MSTSRLSAPSPPSISIEDLSQGPLTNSESRPASPTSANTPKHTRLDAANSKTFTTTTFPPTRRRDSTWRRKRSPAVYWRKRWDGTHYPWANGRVLIVDCFSRNHSSDGKRRTQAYEISRESELREFYETGPGATSDHCLRIIHVQNAVWARSFLLRKFHIIARNDVTGTSFGRWAVYDKPQRRAGKPVLKAKSFRCARDPWRGVSRSGFGMDYLKHYRPGDVPESDRVKEFQLCTLNHWNTDKGNVPSPGYDVYVQRLSVYMQRNEGPVTVSPEEDIKNPYEPNPGVPVTPVVNFNPTEKEREWDTLPLMESMDNNSTIIIFEASHTGYAEDTLIGARQEIETRWRRLMQLLPREDIPNEDMITVELMNIVLKDILKGLQQKWEGLINKCDEHVNILEDKIYEYPADESRAPELWMNSALWLKIEKLISLQISTIGEIQNNMRELADDLDPHEGWLNHTPNEFKSIETMVQEQLVKPTANLSDLMYKSVGIRDARHSLQLGLSMWRLSWITFIFLPLTFIGGFFGMNVDLFQPSGSGYPSIKWYFVAAVPLMLLVVTLYFAFKRADRFDGRANPAERGAYEHIYQDFTAEFPNLWSRYGPRENIEPKGFWSMLKWKLVTYWFDPSRTVAARGVSDIDEMSIWARLQRRIARKWLSELNIVPESSVTKAELGEGGDFSTVTELLAVSTPIAMADGDPTAAVYVGSQRSPQFRSDVPMRSRARPRSRSSSPKHNGDANQRQTSSGNGPMVDMEKNSEDESSDREDRPIAPQTASNLTDGPAIEFDPSPSRENVRTRTRTPSPSSGMMHLSVPLSIRRGDEHAP